ncbi:rap guanine nucleotide exchange factor 2-like protein [Sarcoptes scabiei]|uniref:Rap guanine nucleotide exchange factor 2-like protein n=1 Tax=Sarcoptes scabiei TaxID=52283 RepID=A0A132A5S1_SARSC|nr:rap guanine nucleotide exchange factor 2-like protein [Sarcoptes scabiei]
MSSIELCHSSSNHHKANSSNNHHQQKRSSSSFDLEALIRDSASRTEDDIEIIVRFLSIINSNHDHMTRRRLAPHFVLAEIEARDTRVLTHGEKLDAYCIVAAGSLRHVLPCDDNLLIPETSVDDDTFMDHQSNQYPYSSNRQQCGAISDNHSSPSSSTTSLHHPHQYSHQNTRFLHVGDEFGAHLDDRVVYGEIFTNEDFVWVLCVPHVIFDQICGEKTFKTIRDEVTGNIIEMRANCMLPLSTTNQLEINSLGSTNLTSSDLSLSQFSENKSQTQLEISEDFVSEINIVPAKQNIQTSKQPNSLSSSSTPAKSTKLSSNGNNELIRATKERLYELLLSSEPNENFIEDFLLTFRIWSERDLHPSKDSKIMADLMNRICRSVRNGSYVENCVRIVLIWLVNHYQDFHTENRYLLDEFENALKENSVHKSQLRLFYMHLSAKSIERQVTMTRSDRNSPLLFSLIGGYECSARLFIGELSLSENLANSPKPNQLAQLDLRPGDRIISINGVDCHVMPIGRAYELCRSSTHLSLQVKYDPHLFYALIEGSSFKISFQYINCFNRFSCTLGRHETKRQIVETFPLNSRISSSSSTSSGFGSSSTLSSNNQQIVTSSTKEHKKEKEAGGGNIWKQKVRSLVSTTNQLISSNILHNNSNSSSSNNSPNSSNPSIPNSLSNNSISVNSSSQNSSHPRILSYEIPEIIKIYSFEHNDCCFLPIHSSTTVRECIQLSLRQFKYSSNLSSRDFALYEYSVIMNGSSGPLDESSVANSTVVKRLSEGTSDLVNNIGLNSRLYLKLVNKTKDSSGEALTDSDIAKDIIKDLSVNSLLTLKGLAIARELTARDFRLFCKIESQQFVYDLAFNDPNNHSPSNENSIVFERTRELQEFERKTNEEMFWTINQVLGEKRSISKRVKAIKQLIRIATLAMKLNNYNTLFAIISGLMHLSVSRLKSCWDKVPSKHLKQLQKLQQLMDPSRNFYNFRQQLMQKLREDNGALIIIPFFPLVKKDLSFIWLANQTFINSSSEPPQSNQSGQSDSESHRTEMLVNWEKMRLLSEKIREIQKMANTTSLAMAAVSNLNTINSANLPESSSVANEPIDPNLLFRIFADNLTLDHKSSNDHKKLWENQRMIKRVQ